MKGGVEVKKIMASNRAHSDGQHSVSSSAGSPTDVSKAVQPKLGLVSYDSLSQPIHYPPAVTNPQQYDPRKYTDNEAAASSIGEDGASADKKCCCISIKYQRQTSQGQAGMLQKYEEEATVNDYMRWRFFLNSPEQIEKCVSSLKDREKTDIVITEKVIQIGFPLADGRDCKDIVRKIVRYGISCLDTSLTVEEICLNKTYVGGLNEKFGKEIAICEVICDKVYIVYPQSKREIIGQFVTSCGGELSVIKGCRETVEVHPILRHFEKKLLHKLQLQCGSVDVKLNCKSSRWYCTVEGPRQCVEETICLLKQEFLKADVKFPTATSVALKTWNVEKLINDTLSEAHLECAAEQSEGSIVVFGFDSGEVNKAVVLISGKITAATVPLIGDYLRNNSANVLKYICENYSGKVFAKLDSQFHLNLIGLSDIIEKIKNHLIEVKEGRGALDTIHGSQYSGAGRSFKTESELCLVRVTEKESCGIDSLFSNSHPAGHILPKVSELSAKSERTDLKVKEDFNEVQTKQGVRVTTSRASKQFDAAVSPANMTVSWTDKNEVYQQGYKKVKRENAIEEYQIPEEHLTFIEKFRNVICRTFNVELEVNDSRCTLKSGTRENVLLALEHLKSLTSDRVYITEDPVIDEINSSRASTHLQKEAERNSTTAKKKITTSWTLDPLKVTLAQEVNKCDLSCQENKRLILKPDILQNTDADIKFSLVEWSHSGGSSSVDKQTYDEIRIDDRRESHQIDFKVNFKRALIKADEKKKKSAAFMLNPVAQRDRKSVV